jgi:hypothetical protein
MTPQATALAITRFVRLTFGNNTGWFIRLVLEEFAVAGGERSTEQAVAIKS